MEYRRLGNGGVRVPVIGLGTNRFGTDAVTQETVNNIVSACLDLGINFIDTANTYSIGKSEEKLGIALKGDAVNSQWGLNSRLRWMRVQTTSVSMRAIFLLKFHCPFVSNRSFNHAAISRRLSSPT